LKYHKAASSHTANEDAARSQLLGENKTYFQGSES